MSQDTLLLREKENIDGEKDYFREKNEERKI